MQSKYFGSQAASSVRLGASKYKVAGVLVFSGKSCSRYRSLYENQNLEGFLRIKNLKGFFCHVETQSTYSVFKNLSKVRIRQPYCRCLFVNVYVSYVCLQVNFSKQSLLFNLSSKSLTLKCSPLETIDVRFHVRTGNACMGTQRTACRRLVAKYMHTDVPNIKLLKNSLFFPSTRKVDFCFPLFSMAWHVNVCI